MKKLRCDICGSDELIKGQQGYYTCQKCGIKYSVNDTINMQKEEYVRNYEFVTNLKDFVCDGCSSTNSLIKKMVYLNVLNVKENIMEVQSEKQ